MMGQENLYTQTDGLHSFAQTHSDVAAEMSGAIDPASYAASVAASHGTIAWGMHTALSGAVDARRGARDSVSAIGQNLAESLRQAAHAYEGGDQGAADRLRSAADAVEAATVPGAGRTAGPGGGGLKDLAGTLTSAGKDAAGAVGGVIGPMTSGLGSAASSLGSGLSSAAGAAANSITQAVGQAAKAAAAPAGAVSAAAAAGGGADHPMLAENGRAADTSGGPEQARPGEGGAAGRAPGEHVVLARRTSGQDDGGTVA